MITRQKATILEDLGMFFLELGKVPAAHEFRAMNPVPVRYATIKRYFGGYPRMLKSMESFLPNVWNEIGKPKPAPKPAPKPLAAKAFKEEE